MHSHSCRFSTETHAVQNWSHQVLQVHCAQCCLLYSGFCILHPVLKLVIFGLREHLYFLSAINKLKLKPTVLVVSQLAYSVGDYSRWFKCQMLVSNYNANKISSLEWTEIFQICLLVLVGFYFCPLLTYHFIMKISLIS